MNKKLNEEVSVAELSVMLDQIEHQRRQGQKATLIFAGVFVIVFLGFAFFLKSSVEKKFSEVALQTALKNTINQITPQLPTYARQLSDGLSEVYWSALGDEFRKKMPLLEQKLIAESQKGQNEIKKHLAQSISRHILADPQIKQVVGSVANDTKSLEKVTEIVTNEAEKLGKKISGRIFELYQKDIDSLLASIQSFPRDHRNSQDDALAVKTLLHYLLNLADEELMSSEPHLSKEGGNHV